MSLPEVTAEFLRARPLPDPDHEGDKQQRGRVLVIAGSVEVPGAALLAGLSVLRAGAGVLQIATCRSVAPHLAMAMPEARVVGCDETRSGEIDPSNARRLADLTSGCDAILIGPGMMDDKVVGELASGLLQQIEGASFVLDAAAFTCLRKSAEVLHKHAGRIVVTPHSGEMAKFLDVERSEVDADPLRAARLAASRLGAVVAMKGASTHIVAPDGNAWLCDHGSIALATSGSGDTLAGILAGLLARGATPALATIWAVYLHGEAGRRLAERHGTFGLLAREIPGEIPMILQSLAKAP
jgi:ADP-dependent NAD(P)H-hydrate dehydratase